MTQAVVVGLALLAALCAAVGIVVRQLATQHVPEEHGMSSVMVSALLRNPMWWAGTGSAVAGYVFQALALSFGSLLLVAPLLVSSLLFALPLSARAAGVRVTRGEWLWAIVLTAGLALFVLVGRPREGHFTPTTAAWLIVAVVCVPLITLCVVGAARTIGTRRAVLLAVAVGVMFALVALLTKLCAHRLETTGLGAMLSTTAPYLLVLVAATGTVLQQSAFHAGALQTSVPTMLVLEPVFAVLLGILVLGEQLTAHGPAVLALPVAVAAMLAGTIALGRDTGARDERIARVAAPQA
ncbi:MAG: DMT family transporter [Mycobacterium sp.]|nr:DMT family transporter [Mycobacterium sp.]